MSTGTDWDVARLVSTLRSEISGTVAVDAASKALYAADASNYRAVPDLVVVPRTVEELAAAVTLSADAGAAVTMRGGGTSMAGNAIGSVVIDTSRHVNRLLDLDPESHTAVVEPGVVLTDLLAAAARHRLTFAADPSSASRATLGGMIANNACGAHSVAWGTTADNVRSLEVVLADGHRMTVPAAGALDAAGTDRRMAALRSRPGREGRLHRDLSTLVEENQELIRRRFGRFSRQISGYALDRLLPENGFDVARLLCGSEGSLATTLRATVALTAKPAATVLLVLGFADPVAAADSVPVLLPHGPLTIESINAALVDRLPAQVRREAVAAGLVDGQAWLLVEVGGDSPDQCEASGRAMAEAVADSGLAATSSLATDPRAQEVLWRCRRDAAGLATRRADGAEAWPGWEDAAVPPDRLGDYLRGLDDLLGVHSLSSASYGHFGEGCMHTRINFDLLTTAGVATYRSFVEQATDLVVSLGGSVSGEHGDGRARSELLTKMYGADAVGLFADVKRAWDPANRMNPHVIVDPRPIDEGIRHLGPAAGRELLTVFAYGDDESSFARAQRRCVGVGKCRQTSGGVMCPSYQVTRDEQHSTRGRAHLLWEMVQGEVVTDGWRSIEVRDALDLCLACKGCLSDCPVNVDMATYKAEFTYQHYRGRPRARPRSHWSMGWLPLWARIAARLPGVANQLGASRAQGMLKRLGGIAPEREIPEFAATAFTRWFAARQAFPGDRRSAPRGQIVLWPDTFTTYFAPQVGMAAVQLLEDAGFAVVVPRGPVCCGLTWISTGQLGVARSVLRRSLASLAPHLAAGVPVVSLEPSCTAVFRHDAAGLLPDDPVARAAARSTYTFAEAVRDLAPEWTPPHVGGNALVQVHCHQHAVMGFDADVALMTAAGITAQVPDSGCCGLAGNFGFEAGHHEVSMAAGERVLLPAVRQAAAATSILADGFSCRTQIGQGTDRSARHLAELLASALGGRDAQRG